MQASRDVPSDLWCWYNKCIDQSQPGGNLMFTMAPLESVKIRKITSQNMVGSVWISMKVPHASVNTDNPVLSFLKTFCLFWKLSYCQVAYECHGVPNTLSPAGSIFSSVNLILPIKQPLLVFFQQGDARGIISFVTQRDLLRSSSMHAFWFLGSTNLMEGSGWAATKRSKTPGCRALCIRFKLESLTI